MARVSVIGLGRMGSGMAGRLLAAGHEVVVTNRTRSRADVLVGDGLAGPIRPPRRSPTQTW